MYKWDRASRNFTTNATVGQVQTAVTALHEWLAQSFGEDSVRVLSLDSLDPENHEHYVIAVIGPAKAMSIPMYIGTNCAGVQLADRHVVIENLCLLLGDPSTYAEIEDDAASEEAIQADTKWFMRVADAIVSKVSHKHQIAKMRADLSL